MRKTGVQTWERTEDRGQSFNVLRAGLILWPFLPASHDVLEHDTSSLQVSMHCKGCTATAEHQGHCPAAQPQDSLPIKEAGTGSVPCIAKAEGGEMALNTCFQGLSNAQSTIKNGPLPTSLPQTLTCINRAQSGQPAPARGLAPPQSLLSIRLHCRKKPVSQSTAHNHVTKSM